MGLLLVSFDVGEELLISLTVADNSPLRFAAVGNTLTSDAVLLDFIRDVVDDGCRLVVASESVEGRFAGTGCLFDESEGLAPSLTDEVEAASLTRLDTATADVPLLLRIRIEAVLC